MSIKKSAILAVVRTPMFKMRVVPDKTKIVRNGNPNTNDALAEYYEMMEDMDVEEEVIEKLLRIKKFFNNLLLRSRDNGSVVFNGSTPAF